MIISPVSLECLTFMEALKVCGYNQQAAMAIIYDLLDNQSDTRNAMARASAASRGAFPGK